MKLNTCLMTSVMASGAMLVSSAVAQDYYRQDRQNYDQQEYRQHQQNQGYQQQGSPQVGRWNDDNQSLRVVGYDLDGDGRTDSWYYVSQDDYDRMRQDQFRSSGRPIPGQARGTFAGSGDRRPMDSMRQQQGQQRQQYQQQYQQDNQRFQTSHMARNQQQQQYVSGSIKELKDVKFANDDKEHLVGKIQTHDGRTIPVHFGPKDHLTLDLDKGDEVTVTGRTGRLNDRRILLAQQVRTDEGTARIQTPAMASTGMKQCRGEIIDVKEVELQSGEESLLATLRSDDGRTEIIALGSKDDLDDRDIKIKKGKHVSIIGEQAMINGQPIVLTKQIYVDGEMARVSPARWQLQEADDFKDIYSELDGDARASAR